MVWHFCHCHRYATEWLGCVQRTVAPADTEDLLDYFDQTYVTGCVREIPVGSGSVRRRTTPARFPSELWNVHAVTLNDGHRTNNVAEGWNNRLRNLVGHHHPSVWSHIEALQFDAADTLADTASLQHAVGNLQYVSLSVGRQTPESPSSPVSTARGRNTSSGGFPSCCGSWRALYVRMTELTRCCTSTCEK